MTDERKILVIDDYQCVRRAFERYSLDQFLCPEINSFKDRKTNIALIESLLRSVACKAILLDGELELSLGNPCDGAVLASKILVGDYGETNRNTPLYNISSNYKIPGTLCSFYKPRGEDEDEDKGNIKIILQRVG